MRFDSLCDLLTQPVNGAKLHATVSADPIFLPHRDQMNLLRVRLVELPRKRRPNVIQDLLLRVAVVFKPVLHSLVHLGANHGCPDVCKPDRLQQMPIGLSPAPVSDHEHSVKIPQAHFAEVSLGWEHRCALAWQVPDPNLVTEIVQLVGRGFTGSIALEATCRPLRAAGVRLRFNVLEDGPDQRALPSPRVPEHTNVHETVMLGILVCSVTHNTHEWHHVRRDGILAIQVVPLLELLGMHAVTLLLELLRNALLGGLALLLQAERCCLGLR
mmetsp:Transcript_93785/g.265215  ORF Transcript_93785/g.265215 Transcript_93785/m.265215 type:complete len:271 (+) Transcript_93785:156-968(+)